MRVLVSGRHGYIGSAMVPMLLEDGHQVVGLDSELYEGCTYPGGGAIAPVHELRKDVRDVQLPDVEGFDACMHLAALSNDPLGAVSPSHPALARPNKPCSTRPAR